MGSRFQVLEFGDLPDISRTAKARNFKFGRDTDGSEFQRIKCKIESKRVMWGSRGPLLEFRDPLISREHLKLETSNLARRRMTVSSNEENAKLGQNGSCWGHVTKFWNLGTPLMSREHLKLETSNLARIRMTVSSNEENAKLGQKGSCWGHVTKF